MADWIQFAFTFISSCILIILPGYLFFAGCRFSKSASIGFAPLFSIFFYGVWTIVLHILKIECSWIIVAAPAFAICSIPFAYRFKRQKEMPSNNEEGLFDFFDEKITLVFLVIGIAYAVLVYCLSIVTPTSFVQGFDNAHHLGLVRSMLESGNWSTIDTSLFPGNDGSYYPAIWSILAALIASATKCPITIAANALNVLLMSIVFPFGMFLFSSSSLQKRNAILCCALIFLSFSAIPWMQLRYGPLYPNYSGFALLPAFYSAFIEFALRDRSKKNRIAALACILLGALSIAMCHPSALFTAVVFCIPVCIWAIWQNSSKIIDSIPKKFGIIFAFLIIFIALWKITHDLPFMHSVVTMKYDRQSGLLRSILNTLLLSYPHFSHQLPLAILVALGFCFALKQKEQRFLAACYALICLIYIANMSLEYSPLKSFISGFWYNHATRLAASTALTAIPLAGLGLASLVDLIERIFASKKTNRYSNFHKTSKRNQALIALTLAAIVASPIGIWTNGVEATSMGKVWSRLHSMSVESSGRVVFKSDERDFAQKVAETVGNECYIANVPYDGSGFSFALYGTNVIYRSFSYDDDDENALICQHLFEVANNEKLKDVLAKKNIHYVMILDRDGAEGSSFYSNTYKPQFWSGIDAVQDDTPGFETILSDKDMRLYRITALD